MQMLPMSKLSNRLIENLVRTAIIVALRETKNTLV